MDKVLVCQLMPGHPNHYRTVCVDPEEVPALLANGSYLGPCNNHDGPEVSGEEAVSVEFRLGVSPNPVTDGFVVHVYTPVAQRFEINLFDPQGRMIQNIFRGTLDAGDHEIAVRSIESPAKGMFFLNAVSSGDTRTVRLIRE